MSTRMLHRNLNESIVTKSIGITQSVIAADPCTFAGLL
jgi:hypothetical protein